MEPATGAEMGAAQWDDVVMVGWYCLGLTAAYLLCYGIVVSVPFLARIPDKWSTVDIIFSLPFCPIITYLAFKGTYDLHATPMDRWHSRSPAGMVFLYTYLAKSIVHMVVICLQNITKSFLVMMFLHHITSIICYASSIFFGRMIFFAAFDGMCEITNVFLTVLYAFKLTKTEKAFPMIYQVNGICLWLSFIVFRLILFPVWYYVMYTDVVQHPEVTYQTATSFELAFYPFVTTIIFALSIHWFIPITKGMIRAIFQRKDDQWKYEKQQ